MTSALQVSFSPADNLPTHTTADGALGPSKMLRWGYTEGENGPPELRSTDDFASAQGDAV